MTKSVRETPEYMCNRIHELVRKLPLHEFPGSNSSGLKVDAPKEGGLYFLFEKNEEGHQEYRVVRTGKSNDLKHRLRTHFNGNIGSSALVLEISRIYFLKEGTKYQNTHDFDEQLKKLNTRNFKSEEFREVRERAKEYIQKNTMYRTLVVDNKKDLYELEKAIISTTAECQDCFPSTSWLGRHSENKKISGSGLWQDQHIRGKTINFEGLELLEGYISSSTNNYCEA